MTTSNTVVFRLNRDAIITQALLKIGALDPENTGAITTNQTTNTANALNLMIKGWEAEGLQLWERKYGVIFPQKNQPVYVLGNPAPGGDHATLSTPLGSGFIRTTATTAIAAGATSVTVVATDNAATPFASVGVPTLTMTNSDFIGIQQTDGTMFWTTIANVNVNTKVVTLTLGPTIGSSVGAYITTYTTKLMRPLRILDGFTRQVQGNDIPHLLLPREQYNRFGMKTSPGTPIQTYYDQQENVGHLYVYPTAQDVTQQIFIEFQKPIEDFNNATDDFDLPQEWGECIVWNLAARLIPDYGCPEIRANQVIRYADMFMKRLDGWDQETGSIYIQPSQWAYYEGSGK
jgi:hypothetical protein